MIPLAHPKAEPRAPPDFAKFEGIPTSILKLGCKADEPRRAARGLLIPPTITLVWTAPGNAGCRGASGRHTIGERLPPWRNMRVTRGVVICALFIWVGLGSFFLPKALGQSCVSVTTYHNDNLRTGQNLSETAITPANVASLKQRFATTPVFDGWAVAQPLYLPQTTINGAVHNVVFVATLANSVYAFDADTGKLYWRVVYGPPDTIPYQSATGCTDSGFNKNPSGGAGIVGTPVIDTSITPPAIYFVTKEFDSATSTHALRLHAVDTSTGNELTTAAVLQGSVVNHAGKTVTFAAEYQMSRPGLLLSNGTIYIGLGSSGCRNFSNYGWVMSYTFSPATGFTQQAVFNTVPDLANPSGKAPFANGGIWQAGGALAADASGNVFFETADGNNFFNTPTGWQGTDFGDSFVKLTPTLGPPASSASYFTPFNDRSLYSLDLDLGSTGPVLLPDQPGLHTHMLVGYGKSEEIYVVDRDNMGGYTGPNGPNNIVQDVPDPAAAKCSTGSTQFTMCASQKGTCGWNAPIYWNNNLYFSSNPGPLLAYGWTPGSATPLAACPTVEAGFSAGTYVSSASPSLSANGTSGGLLWVVTWLNTRVGTLRAFDATNLASQLFQVSISGVGGYPTPTIANGTVYVATKGRLFAYGAKGLSGCRATKAAATEESRPNQPAAAVVSTKTQNSPGRVF